MVTEMEWKCCNGYSGEDCSNGPNLDSQNSNSGSSTSGSNVENEQKGGEGKEIILLNMYI